MTARVTLRDVAREAEVSVSAASLSLSGSVRISAATAARVRAAAAALGYVRDHVQAAAAAGRFKHAGRMALIAVWAEQGTCARLLNRHASSMGMVVRSVDAEDSEALSGVLRDMGAAALVVHRRYLASANLRPVSLPVVMWCDEGEGGPQADLIETCEWWTTSVQTAERVRLAGYRRPVAVLTPAKPPHWHDDVRLGAMRAARVPTLVWDGGHAPLLRFLDRHRPDAVIGGNIHVLRALQDLERPLPFAALLTFSTPWHRNCAGWIADQDRGARMTLELIEQRLRYGERPPCRIVIPPRWRDAASLPPASG
jgi:DNA-binding LacI/PurR family transcriptional regulator